MKTKIIAGVLAGIILAYASFCFYKPEYAEQVATGYSILLGKVIELCTIL
jgi:hypothetical protein|nr:MAG TPA: Protein of unknown function (DUF1138) [Caudoviricetes sp.]